MTDPTQASDEGEAVIDLRPYQADLALTLLEADRAAGLDGSWHAIAVRLIGSRVMAQILMAAVEQGRAENVDAPLVADSFSRVSHMDFDDDGPVTKMYSQKALAEAWQAGYLRGTLDNESDLEPADNPYRETSR